MSTRAAAPRPTAFTIPAVSCMARTPAPKRADGQLNSHLRYLPVTVVKAAQFGCKEVLRREGKLGVAA